MEELYLTLKSRFDQGKLIKINPKIIEINFKNSNEPVIIKKEINLKRYTVSYPELITLQKGKTKDRYSTINNILIEGVIWILNQVEKNGKVLPEF